MRILFDQGTPAPLRHALAAHSVSTTGDMGWSNLQNGDLLAAAELQFHLIITTDQSLKYQQHVTGRKLAIIVLMTTSWPVIRTHVSDVVAAVDQIQGGEYRELAFPRP